MKRFQLELMGVLLLSLATVFWTGSEPLIRLLPFVWLVVHVIVARAFGTPIYWIEDAYALVPLEGVARTILRGIVSLIAACVGAIIFGVAYVTLYEVLVQPADGSTYFGWMAWVPLLLLGYAVPFNVTWKMLPQRNPRYTARLSA